MSLLLYAVLPPQHLPAVELVKFFSCIKYVKISLSIVDFENTVELAETNIEDTVSLICADNSLGANINFITGCEGIGYNYAVLVDIYLCFANLIIYGECLFQPAMRASLICDNGDDGL